MTPAILYLLSVFAVSFAVYLAMCWERPND